MVTKTSLLGLTKPAYTEAADIAVLNTNFDLIDKAVGQGARVQNLLDNSDFRNPINQRGITSGATVAAWSYSIDRWLNYTGSAGTITFTNEGIRYSFSNLQQPIPPTVKTGTVVTAAAKWSDGTLLTATGTITRGTAWTWFHSSAAGGCQIGVADQGNSNSVHVSIVSGEKTLVWAALYEGAYTAETLPAYVYKGYAAELAECRRYYLHVGADDNAWLAGKYVLGWGLVVEFPVQMRVNPTIQIGSAGSVMAFSSAGWETVSYGSTAVRGGITYVVLGSPANVSPGDTCLVKGIAGLSADL